MTSHYFTERLLIRESQQPFVKSETFEGVETRDLSLSLVPQESADVVAARNCHITRFFIIKTTRDISNHPHENDGEIYLSGRDGTIMVNDFMGNRRAIQQMAPGKFVITEIGESHSLMINHGTDQIVFLAIKFEKNRGGSS